LNPNEVVLGKVLGAAQVFPTLCEEPQEAQVTGLQQNISGNNCLRRTVGIDIEQELEAR
jgi:hypothetical protein